MIWQIKYMIDPGDGIVNTKQVDLDTDDICEIAADAMNGDIEGIPEVFIIGIELMPPK